MRTRMYFRREGNSKTKPLVDFSIILIMKIVVPSKMLNYRSFKNIGDYFHALSYIYIII